MSIYHLHTVEIGGHPRWPCQADVRLAPYWITAAPPVHLGTLHSRPPRAMRRSGEEPRRDPPLAARKATGLQAQPDRVAVYVTPLQG